MREIKFRAWNKDQKKMFNNDWLKAAYIYYWGLVDSRNIEPMQWTGLLDKNGKEIYEGDILTDEYNSIGVVKFNHDDASFVIEYGSEIQAFDSPQNWAIVFGNIYEHKDLLNPELL